MFRRQLLASVAADKGEGHVARQQSIGEAADRLTAEIGVEQSAIDPLVLKRLERVGNRGERPNHDKAALLQRAGDIERDEKLVLNDKDAFGCHCQRPVAVPPEPDDFRTPVLSISANLITPVCLAASANPGTMLRLRTLDRHLWKRPGLAKPGANSKRSNP